MPMRKRLSFQQKQRVREERVEKMYISLDKSSEPQVGIEPASIQNLRKYDCLNAILLSIASMPFQQPWWPSGRAFVCWSSDPGSNLGQAGKIVYIQGLSVLEFSVGALRRQDWGHHFFFINMSVISPGVGTSLRGDVPTLAQGGTGIPPI